ncbi:MAG: S1 RNA-binding domain-containing protein, partial [Acutalibacteraceae bacterium]
VDGLIHISQIANKHVAKPADVLKIGEKVQVKITEVDEERKRVSLSIRALLPVEEVAEEATEDTAEEEAEKVTEEATVAEEAAVEEAPVEE